MNWMAKEKKAELEFLKEEVNKMKRSKNNENLNRHFRGLKEEYEAKRLVPEWISAHGMEFYDSESETNDWYFTLVRKFSVMNEIGFGEFKISFYKLMNIFTEETLRQDVAIEYDCESVDGWARLKDIEILVCSYDKYLKGKDSYYAHLLFNLTPDEYTEYWTWLRLIASSMYMYGRIDRDYIDDMINGYWDLTQMLEDPTYRKDDSHEEYVQWYLIRRIVAKESAERMTRKARDYDACEQLMWAIFGDEEDEL